ncbi:c-type cytochrome [Marinobacter sp.]|uniref:c-type cytochrome n=1 Tax=Marinobacter sp. TaxID=50741 RepID=UPI00384FED52
MRALKPILIFILLVLIGCAVLIYSGTYNVAADEPHAGAVKTLLNVIRNRSVHVRLDNISPPPDLNSPERVERGGRLYGANCAGCHLGPGQEETPFFRGLNPQPPRLTLHGGHHDPKYQFWVIKHGIRMTGMPAWGVTKADDQLWDLTAFLRELPEMSAETFRTRTAPEDNAGS